MAPHHHPCDVSPFCGPVPDRVLTLGLSAELPWRWVHLGPITTASIRVTEHRPMGWGCSRILRAHGGIGRFGGYHLDLLGMVSPPRGVQASYHALTQLWYVLAVAYRDADGPSVEWLAEPSGPGRLLTAESIVATSDDEAIAGRCKDLIRGRYIKRGRPPKSPEAIADDVQIALDVASIKARHPKRKLALIAEQIGADPRTIRRKLAVVRRYGQIVDRGDGVVEFRRYG